MPRSLPPRRPSALLRRVALALASPLLLMATLSAATVDLKWSALPPLPPSAGQRVQPGVASPFVGVHGDALLVAGGANFPNKMPWQGGAKIWWDDIWVLERPAGGEPRWVTDKTYRLPRRLGYGASVSTPAGVVCVGGSDAERCYAETFLLAWDARAREVRRTELPAMPEPLSLMAGALVGQTLYVAGGQHTMKDARATTVFWSLDLSAPGRAAWKKLPPWPGPARVLPVAVAQGGEFFLFSGRLPQPGQPTQLLSDAYAYHPARGQWRTLAPVGGGAGRSVMAGTGAPAGSDEVLLFGGDRGDLFLELEAHDLAIAAARQKLAAASADRPALERDIERHLQAKLAIYDRHPGFGREVFAYDTRRDTWRVVGQSPVPPQVTTTAVRWGEAIVIPSGEIRPGVRTTNIVRVVPTTK